jgi:hydrogenase nickel incorporation protein HypB
MCQECGCEERGNDNTHKNQSSEKAQHVPGEESLSVNRAVTDVNDLLARQISSALKQKRILCINMMGSPGSGKTSFIEGISAFIPSEDIAVIQGDLESDIDKKRLERKNIYTYQVNTHSGCHLNAMMINKAVLEMDLKGKKYLVIENVGNLVCPAGVNIGQHMNIVISSTAEGFDKPKKYPYIFMDAKLIIISKSDLSEHVGFDEKTYLEDVRKVNGKVKILKVSSKDSFSFKEASHHIVHTREHLIGEEHSHPGFLKVHTH